jgi:transposase
VEQVELKDRRIPGDIKNYISDLETVNNSLKVKSTSLENEAIILKEKIEDLQAKLHLALFKKYGRSSEKIDPTQIDFFEVSETDEESIEKDTPIIVAAHPRKKPGRKALDPAIPRKIIVHDIVESDKICGCGHELVKVGEEITERLQIIPERVYVEQHVRPKWACRHCEGSGDEENPVFRIATTPPTMIPSSIVTAGLLAFIFVNKFVDHLPFYRQEKRFEIIGAHISRQNMSNWSLKVYETLKPLEKLLKQEVKAGPYIQMDETPLQVMGEERRPDTSKSYMWLARGGPPETPIIYYNYQETRKAKFVKDFLEDYHGFLQSDGYKGYEAALKGNKDIIHVGCLAHARREFFDATKASKKAGSAHIALKKIVKIYHKENELKDLELGEDEFLKQRKIEVKPLLDDKAQKVRPVSDTGKAIRYTIGQLNKIISYLDCAESTPDNNAAERSIKPFVVGRKNWLFSGSPTGANASALLFSLIETAKANNLNPYGYLKWIFEETPLIKSEKEFEKFLPENCERDKINQFQFNGL